MKVIKVKGQEGIDKIISEFTESIIMIDETNGKSEIVANGKFKIFVIDDSGKVIIDRPKIMVGNYNKFLLASNRDFNTITKPVKDEGHWEEKMLLLQEIKNSKPEKFVDPNEPPLCDCCGWRKVLPREKYCFSCKSIENSKI